MGQNFPAWSGSSCKTALITPDFCDRTSPRKSLMYSWRFCSLGALAGAAAFAGAFWGCAAACASNAGAETRNARTATAVALCFNTIRLQRAPTYFVGPPPCPECGRTATLKVVRRRKTQTTATAPGNVEAAENSLMTMASPQC